MLLWEVSAFNKLFKTDKFGRIRPRIKDLQTVFVLAVPEKTNLVEMVCVRESDQLLSDSDSVLLARYQIPAASIPSSAVVSTLYLYDCILAVMRIHGLVPFPCDFAEYVSRAFLLSFADEAELTRLFQELDTLLAARTTLLRFRITPADLLVISGLKRNPMSEKVMGPFTNVKRWAEWVQGLLGIDYDKIVRQWEKKQKAQVISVQKLTSSASLVAAVKARDLALAEKLIKQRANVNSVEIAFDPAKKEMIQQSILHIACGQADLPMVHLLISSGAIVDAEDKYGLTPLYYAIKAGSIPVCEELLVHKADPNHRESQRRTPFYWAANCRRLEMLEFLVAHGVDVNAATKLGRTALSKACWNGDVEVVRALLQFTGKVLLSHSLHIRST